MDFSKEEIVFLKRMLHHFIEGKSVEDCAKAVIEDDERIFEALFDRKTSYFIPTYDERGRSHSTNEGKGDVIAREISKKVYNRFREGENK